MSRPRPLVALVGAPNVGKSTLANALARTRRSITAPVAGVTRDAVLHLVAKGRYWVLDTGGQATARGLAAEVSAAARRAEADADLVVVVLDGRRPPTADEEGILKRLAAGDRPYLVALNKVDHREAEMEAWNSAGSLPVEPHLISAEGRRGLDALHEAIRGALGEQEFVDPREWPLVGFFGRPGVGKSTLFNRLLDAPLSIVSNRGPTTRDTVEAIWDGPGLRVLDTGGLARRPRRQRLEAYARRRTLGALGAVAAGIVLVDPAERPGHQDKAIIGRLLDAGAGVIMLAGKADLGLEAAGPPHFATHIPVLPVSGLTGEGIDALAPAVLGLLERRRTRIPTPALNRVLGDAAAAWPRSGRHAVRLFYATQVGGEPPAFHAFVSDPERVTSAHKRTLESALRAVFPLEGVGLRFIFRSRRPAAPTAPIQTKEKRHATTRE